MTAMAGEDMSEDLKTLDVGAANERNKQDQNMKGTHHGSGPSRTNLALSSNPKKLRLETYRSELSGRSFSWIHADFGGSL